MDLRNLALAVSIGLAGLTVSCAHDIKKAEIPQTANPTEEVSRLESEINAGYSEQLDVLANEPFTQARESLEEAKSDLTSGESPEEVLENVGYAQAYLTRAKELAAGRRTGLVEPILEARNAALSSGAKGYASLTPKIKDLDDEMRKASKDFRARLSQQDITRLQGGYLGIELAGIQAKELGQARAKVAGARRDGARTNTPRTLAHAELAVANAEQVIAANRHNAPGYTEAVDKANSATQLLVEVLATSKRPDGPDIDENAALKLVAQSRRIASLEGKLGTAETSVTEMSENLREQNRALKGAASAINIQQALKETQAQFDRDEAEVFLDGNQVLIRLKAMNFPSGKADLPPDSITLLAKVKEAAQNLGPANVIVEGHTDSTGKATTNMTLSQQRAETVARYLEENGLGGDRIDAVGQGYKKPIASNKSKAGRAQNRRVDVIITPTQASSSGSVEEPPSSN